MKSKQMQLNGLWELRGRKEKGRSRAADTWNSQEFFTTAAVPGNLEIELVKAGCVPDVFFGRNAEQLRKYEFFEWLFSRDFEYDGTLRNPRLILEGVDCFGTVFLNGQEIGTTSDAFIAHEFPVEQYLRVGTNRVAIHLASANNRLAEYPLLPGAAPLCAFNQEALWIRKPAHSWGWDIAPRTALGGLWRDVYLEETPEHRVEELFIDTIDANAERAKLRLHLKMASPALSENEKLQVEISGVCEDDTWVRGFALWSYSCSFEFALEHPRLWQPRNYGEANIYRVTVRIKTPTGAVLCESGVNLGIRRIELKSTGVCGDSPAPDFQFLVNGNPIRIFGTNHVPADVLHSRDRERYDTILDNAVALNCNMLRVWGGGVCEEEEFYERCDREGILVWQDFLMGCAIYPDTVEFHSLMEREAAAIVRKLRQHPSLAIWVGDNEGDLINDWIGYRLDPNENRITRELLPRICRMFDPLRPYMPSSPFITAEGNRIGRECGRDGLEFAAEQHLWGVRDYFKSDFYTDNKASFISEIGYHGSPGAASIKKFIPAESLWPAKHNPMWDYHASAPYLEDSDMYVFLTELMSKHIMEFFGFEAQSLEEFTCASQIVQAEGLKFFIERIKQDPKRSGILWWNLMDSWPQFSNAVVDYYGAKKLAWHFIKVCQQGVLGMLSEADAWNREIIFANDTDLPVAGDFELFDALSGESLRCGKFSVAANRVVSVLSFKVFSTAKQLLGLRWKCADGRTGVNHKLTGYPPFDFAFFRSRILPALAALYGTFDADAVGK